MVHEADDLKISKECHKCLQECQVQDCDIDHCVKEIKVMSDNAMVIKHDLENLNDKRNEIIIENEQKLKEAKDVTERLTDQNFEDIAKNVEAKEPETEAII